MPRFFQDDTLSVQAEINLFTLALVLVFSNLPIELQVLGVAYLTFATFNVLVRPLPENRETLSLS